MIEWDIFLAHSNDDKGFVRLLVESLESRGARVWFDESRIDVGASLFQSIQEGISSSRFGVVVVSPSFLAQLESPSNSPSESGRWSSMELGALFASHRNSIIPVWHGVTTEQVAKHYSLLADRRAVDGSIDIEDIAEELVEIVKPSLRRASDFFRPLNGQDCWIYYHRSYSAYLEYPLESFPVSTTDKFLSLMESISNASKDAGCDRFQRQPVDYIAIDERRGHTMRALASESNIVSYASSKINICTELMLERLCEQWGIRVAFVEQKENRRPGVSFSPTDVPDPKTRFGLEFDQQHFLFSDGLDHGLLARIVHPSGKIWWILAGCGRAGSVAAQKLIFDEDWSHELLWPRLSGQDPRRGFITQFTVHYEPKNSHQPSLPDIGRWMWLDSNSEDP